MRKGLTDFEYLYMLRQGCNCAHDEFMLKYNAMLWKLSHIQFHSYKPDGVQVNDLYQEAKIGLLEALYTYRESKEVGLAHYVKICVQSHIGDSLRKCSTKSYRLLDTRLSLDMDIADDGSLTFMDLLECKNLEFNPHYQASKQEHLNILKARLKELSTLEKQVYNFWNQGYSYKEIATKTTFNEKKIDNLIQKIKRIALNS